MPSNKGTCLYLLLSLGSIYKQRYIQINLFSIKSQHSYIYYNLTFVAVFGIHFPIHQHQNTHAMTSAHENMENTIFLNYSLLVHTLDVLFNIFPRIRQGVSQAQNNCLLFCPLLTCRPLHVTISAN